VIPTLGFVKTQPSVRVVDIDDVPFEYIVAEYPVKVATDEGARRCDGRGLKADTSYLQIPDREIDRGQAADLDTASRLSFAPRVQELEPEPFGHPGIQDRNIKTGVEQKGERLSLNRDLEEDQSVIVVKRNISDRNGGRGSHQHDQTDAHGSSRQQIGWLGLSNGEHEKRFGLSRVGKTPPVLQTGTSASDVAGKPDADPGTALAIP